MTLVAGVDSSTQSCKVVVRDAETGRLVREGRAAHPDGTEVHPSHWWSALRSALADAGGLSDVAALSVAGQQHGMVCLDEAGEVVREALLWNDTRSAAAAAALTDELGAAEWAARIGLVPVASFTITKLRWLAQNEPANARRTAAVCLPHDWLTWRLRGTGLLYDLVTDRSDASGTGYFDSVANEYVPDLLSLALGRSDVVLPQVLGPAEWRDGPSRLGSDVGGQRDETVRLAAGAGDNAAAMLGVGGGTDVVVSLGTSGVVTATSEVRAADASGIVAGFADATGRYLPLACTLNAARVLDATARMLGVDLAKLSDLALSAKAGAEGVVMVPYLEGERTPNLPDATGALHGLTLTNATPANIARAAVEGMLCGLAVGLDALAEQGADVTGVRLVGGAAVSPAVREIAPMVFGVPVTVPAPDEYVANGAARQAAWTLTGGATPPEWTLAESTRYEAEAVPEIRARYGDAAQRYLSR
ncbi:xylulokinase [Lentzea albidocapillata subsp. violacea]|uniref:Xylulose kinase n=1 Tax=Lentzea albidocapillata subsp. violacea TaxID=128104 RepID=A0A1G8Q2D0_9PSEU|nr:xylulokinase [Lentzea albidocapillata]SDI98877.1 xylulokinase [Lentzea albidocapillata subsp. violacea]